MEPSRGSHTLPTPNYQHTACQTACQGPPHACHWLYLRPAYIIHVHMPPHQSMLPSSWLDDPKSLQLVTFFPLLPPSGCFHTAARVTF